LLAMTPTISIGPVSHENSGTLLIHESSVVTIICHQIFATIYPVLSGLIWQAAAVETMKNSF